MVAGRRGAGNLAGNLRSYVRAIVQGEADLLRKFDELRGREQGQIARKAILAGLARLNDAARSSVPAARTPGHDTQSIRESIRYRLATARDSRKTSQAGIVGVGVGRRRRQSLMAAHTARVAGAKRTGGAARHAHWYVLGTQQRANSSGANRGRTSANPVMDRAQAKAGLAAERIAADILSREIDRLARAKGLE